MMTSEKGENNPQEHTGWGKVFIAARLEKMVEAGFVTAFLQMLTSGFRPGDRWGLTEGATAHQGANQLVQQFLQTDCDSILFVDSDWKANPDFLTQLRDYTPGWEFDALQAAYVRRGWPPDLIFMVKGPDGKPYPLITTSRDTTAEVALVGLHSVLIRRKVFEKLLGDGDPQQFDWFFYPRHQKTTEDSAFSFEARAAGFRLGATTCVVPDHIAHLPVGWEWYQDWLRISGKIERRNRQSELIALAMQKTGLSEEEVVLRVIRGAANVRERWLEVNPQGSEEERAFYADENSGYLFDLIHWNISDPYAALIHPLESYRNRQVLVVGAGLGTEAGLLAERNRVTCYDLPGALREFACARLGATVNWLDGETLPQAVCNGRARTDQPPTYDLVVAIDVVEHIHPDELPPFLEAVDAVLKPGGELYCHANFNPDDQKIYPMHHDHGAIFAAWLEKGFEKVNDLIYRKKEKMT